MDGILDQFRLKDEREDFQAIIESIDSGVEFKGTNLWILVFAIFIASLGLNVNSTAVVIGAMLVSPLMGPIMGLGLGMAINDLALLRRALFNYLFAMSVGLTTSTIYFLISPLKDASTEVLARTSPNIYDVLIALFGGLAGILAVSSRKKANVIPGVAIATALMPPLCTAGYGIANWNLGYFTGALYLFVINTVFIALAAMVTSRFLHFPYKDLPDERDQVMAKRLVWGIVVLTLLPSVYFGYDMIQQNRFRARANQFVDLEAVFPNDFLLKKVVDSKNRKIELTYGGEHIPEEKIAELRGKMLKYGITDAELEIHQGFSYERNGEINEQEKRLTNLLNDKEIELQGLRDRVNSIDRQRALGQQIFKELNVQYPAISSCVVQRVGVNGTDSSAEAWLALLSSDSPLTNDERKKIKDWLLVRLGTPDLMLYFQSAGEAKENGE